MLKIPYEKKEYEVAPEGLWQGVCCDVIDRGYLETPWGHQHKIDIRWQIEETNSQGKRFWVTKRFTATWNEKGHLRPFLEAWRGKKFSEEDMSEFDIESLIGANCQLQIVHDITDRGTYANVQAIMGPPKGAPKMRVEDYTRDKDREDAKKADDGEDSVPF